MALGRLFYNRSSPGACRDIRRTDGLNMKYVFRGYPGSTNDELTPLFTALCARLTR